MIPTIRFCTTPETAPAPTWASGKYKVFRIEIDRRAVGPVITEKDAAIVAKWLDLSWEELP